jgi:hypothetical protein
LVSREKHALSTLAAHLLAKRLRRRRGVCRSRQPVERFPPPFEARSRPVRRTSAIVALDVPELVVNAEGRAVSIRRDKTDHESHGRALAIRPRRSRKPVPCARSVRAWLDTVGGFGGSVFGL